MISRTTEKFRALFVLLPNTVKAQAKEAYQQFKSDPYHPSLQFKRVHSSEPIYSDKNKFGLQGGWNNARQ